MTVTVTSNKKNVSACVHVTANATITIAGNSSVSSIATGGEVITGATITQAYFGCSSSSTDTFIKIVRGSNTVAVFDSTGYMDFAGNGMSLNVNNTADLVITFNGNVNGYLFLELQKIGANSASDYFQN